MAVDSNYLYRADLGDAYPRAVALTATAHGSAVSSPSKTASIVNIPGSIGDNYTGFDLGGIALSGSSYVVAGCGVTESNEKMNIFISASSKSNLKENVTWITNYNSDSLIDVGTPKILHLKNDQFLLMWEERNTESNTYSTKAMLLASDGSKASSVYSLRFALSGCEPVVDSNGRVIWYYTDECSPKFVTIDPYRLGEASAQAAKMKEIGLCDIYVGEYGLYYTGKEVRPNVVIDAEEGTLVEGKDYKLTYSDNINAGRASVTITGIGEYSGSIKMFYTIGKASHDIQWDNLGYYVETGAAFNLNAHCDTSDKLTYESEDTSVLTVDADGKVTAVGDGDTYIRIIAGETDNYEKTTRTASFSVSRDYHTMVEDKVIYANGDDNIATIIKKCSVCGKTEEQQIKTITSISYLMYYSDGFGISYLSSNLRPGDEFRIGLGGYSPEYPDDTTIVVESSDSSVMTVDDTTVKFVGPGTVTMTVYPKYNPSVKYTRTFTVTDGSGESTDDPYDTGSEAGAIANSTDYNTNTVEKGKTIKAGKIVKKNGSRYTVLSGSKKTVALKKAKNVKSFTVPSTIKIKGYGTFKVVQIKANAFTGNKLRSVTIGKNVSKIRSKAFNKSKVTTITLKTKKLKKANVKGCLKGSKVKTVKVRITKKASSKTNKTYVKKYKKYFTKKNAGRKVRIK